MFLYTSDCKELHKILYLKIKRTKMAYYIKIGMRTEHEQKINDVVSHAVSSRNFLLTVLS